MNGRVLIVAGSVSGGGAGIQADVKTVTALDGFAATAITALTIQNTLGVAAVHPVPPEIVAGQMEAVLADIGADCVKTGMLGDAAIIAAVADVLERLAPEVPLVVDPVMLATSGAALLHGSATEALIGLLVRRARLLTPNIPEAAVLLGRAIPDRDAMARAALELLGLGCAAVLLKGGHLDDNGPDVVDLLATADGVTAFAGLRLASRSTHGTGCTLASAVACGLAQGLDLAAAVGRARAYVRRAIETAPGLGHGHGPLNHAHTVGRFMTE